MAPMLSADLMMAFPADLQSDGYVPALCDNGASLGASCVRSTAGAIPGTFSAAEAGSIDIGDGESKLECKGSYLYLAAVRRLTAPLRRCCVASATRPIWWYTR